MESLAFINNSNCESDFEFSLKADLHNEPPRVFYHEIIAPQTIEIRFNETVTLQKNLADAVKIVDKHTKKKVTVSEIELSEANNIMLVHTKNMPDTSGAFYHVTLMGIENICGTKLKGDSKNMTVVYRPKQFR